MSSPEPEVRAPCLDAGTDFVDVPGISRLGVRRTLQNGSLQVTLV